MIRTFTARGYGCLEDITLKLTPLHALIGPNDSGKSTILQAITTLCMCAGQRRDQSKETRISLSRFYFSGVEPALSAGVSSLTRYEVAGIMGADPEQRVYSANGVREQIQRLASDSVGLALSADDAVLSRGLDRSRLLRLRPESLRKSGGACLHGAQVEFADENGNGLASVYQAINSRTARAFIAIEESLQRLFPSVASLQVQPVNPTNHSLFVTLRDGSVLAPEQMSEGMLYYLAFAALQHLSPVAVLCVEEPENGLHPARIKEVVGMLRRISEGGTQVILATHSPLVLNELDPTEVTVVTRPKGGATQVTPMIETANFQQRSRVYALGELWVSYADGEVEAPLMHAEQGAL